MSSFGDHLDNLWEELSFHGDDYFDRCEAGLAEILCRRIYNKTFFDLSYIRDSDWEEIIDSLQPEMTELDVDWLPSVRLARAEKKVMEIIGPFLEE